MSSVSVLSSQIEWSMHPDQFSTNSSMISTSTQMSTKAMIAGSKSAMLLLQCSMLNALARSPGYALTLLAETTTGALHCSEAVSTPGGAPEDTALRATHSLLNEISRGGCVDRNHQVLVLLLMVLGSEDIGRCRMGEPTART